MQIFWHRKNSPYGNLSSKGDSFYENLELWIVVFSNFTEIQSRK